MKSIILANESYTEGQPSRLITLDRLCGVTLLERHLRTLKTCKIQRATIIVQNGTEITQAIAESRTASHAFTQAVEQEHAATACDDDGDILLIAGDYFIEQRLIDYLINMSKPGVLVDRNPSRETRDFVSRSTHASAGCAVVTGKTLRSLFQRGIHRWENILDSLISNDADAIFDIDAIPTYSHSIRRHRRSRWMKIVERNDLEVAHTWVIDGAQKGSLDLPAQVLHAPIENDLVSRLTATSITPNQITLITSVAAWIVTWGILSGFMWLSLVGAAFVGILDGLDGKLARAKLMTSKVGELEHLSDMLFEYSWWLSLGWVLGQGSVSSPAFMTAIGLVAVNFADTVIGVLFWLLLGRTHNRILDNYTRFELAVRKISGRRNIYVWILLLIGPFTGLEIALSACVWWGVVSIAVRGGRTLWFVLTRQAPSEFSF